MKLEIKLSDLGRSLMSRDIGEKAREQLLGVMEETRKITISFEGVFMISNSFADECLGKLIKTIGLQRFKECFEVSGLVDTSIELILKRAIKQRLAADQN
ncbi:hypothetical protein CHH61_03600 [Shouchella clausii]|uniref:DUF4325 domain-containing protein n=1 Tax=Shouchella clausii TaxID=79880 RepID=A0A268S666_SHOCL|nr:STAS-like domain-containing protein [Shouchella clausii]PAF27416.1 hypothetical protein CHH61_03600 [Shouchella clausii]